MKRSILWLKVCALIALSGPMASSAMGGHQRADAEVIIEWNTLLQQFNSGQPFTQTRTYAMLHVAMADAVIAIEGRYEPLLARVRASPNASPEAAAAQAGHDVFIALITSPEGRAAADAALLARLNSLHPSGKASGVLVGKKVAAEIIAARLNDG